jgi:hypothetical protein
VPGTIFSRSRTFAVTSLNRLTLTVARVAPAVAPLARVTATHGAHPALGATVPLLEPTSATFVSQ